MRLGSIQFINSLPVDLGLAGGKIPIGAELVSGTPAELNQKMLDGALDISPISAFFYAEHQEDFLILPDLSISSLSGVQSVLLFSRLKFRNLEDGVIAISGQGRTTPVLCEILSRLRYGFTPRFEQMPMTLNDIPKNADAMLLIGDEALVARQHLKDSNVEIIDLAAEWHAWTKLPIVFALWAVRREFFEKEPEAVFAAHRAILQSKAWGLKNLEAVYAQSYERTGLPLDVLRPYFSKLTYDLGEEMKKGMALYFDHAVKCHLLKRPKKMEIIEKSPVRLAAV